MDIFNSTHSRLLENDFSVIEIEQIEKMSAVLYKSSIHNVIVKKIHNTEEMKSIRSLSLNIRSIMLDYKENVWNTYLLFCIADEIDFETNYKIERDTIALRKYAICSELDLNRVPFLDEFREIKKPVKNIIEIEEGNEYLKTIINYLETNDGQRNKLNVNQINVVTKKIIDMVETRHENR
ncbi:ABC-three component system middle component 1 [Paenibacillus jamilae]|uniref:ABC-three component system middle component 1 n=1 Tax=Paenibacillus TaxID=44249 RepID=UPI002ED2EFEF|nr:ABC-three component system middle component 1 [Paenibacillus polymyxa]